MLRRLLNRNIFSREQVVFYSVSTSVLRTEVPEPSVDVLVHSWTTDVDISRVPARFVQTKPTEATSLPRSIRTFLVTLLPLSNKKKSPICGDEYVRGF